MKIWLDDVREQPQGYTWCKSVNECKNLIEYCEKAGELVEVVDCDHDLGDYAYDGGDGIKLLDWLLERNTLYNIELHTMNPVGRQNMQRMINRYWNNLII